MGFAGCWTDRSERVPRKRTNGALHGWWGSPGLINCTITSNTATVAGAGGGIWLDGGMHPAYWTIQGVMANSILWNNTATTAHEMALFSCGMQVSYSDLPNPASNPTDYGEYGLPTLVAGCIHDDPLFADSDNQDFHLMSCVGRWTGSVWVTDMFHSPGIDAGNPNDSYANEPSPNGGRINMGHHGNTTEASKNNVGNQYGYVSVAITPPDAIAAGAQWQLYRLIVDTFYLCGDWNQSGGVVGPVLYGSDYYIAVNRVTGYAPDEGFVYYQEIPGNLLDAPRTVNQSNNSFAVNFAQAANLQVTITPSGAISNGAKWTLLYDNGGLCYVDHVWHNSGDSYVDLPLTYTYYIGVKDIRGYVPSASATAYPSFDSGVMYVFDQGFTLSHGGNSRIAGYTAANVIYVSTSGNDSTGTGNEFAPFRHIQYAIGRNWGSQIQVVGDINNPYNENITINRNVHVYGDGAGTTTILGTGSGSVVTMTYPVTLYGFTIRGGGNVNYGGGIYTTGGTISNCIIRNNSTGIIRGGGVYTNGTVNIQSCYIYNNSATNPTKPGRQIYAATSGLTVSGSWVTNIFQVGDPWNTGFFLTADCAYNQVAPTNGGDNHNYQP